MNWNRQAIVVALVTTCWVPPAFSTDPAVQKAFAEVVSDAVQEKTDPDEKVSKQYFQKKMNHIRWILTTLNQPDQLVQLIALCKSKTGNASTNQKYKPYQSYFVYVQEFAIFKLGHMAGGDARKALERVKPIIKDDPQMLENWNEASSIQKEQNIPR